jgi:hypothetical protein
MIAGIKKHPEAIDVAFRAFDNQSHAQFFDDRRDIRCSNWRQFNVDKPLTKRGAEKHIENAPMQTDYISISTSPRRTWNWVVKKESKARQTIAVVDLRVLRRLGIAYGSSTDDLGFRHFNETYGTGTKWATKHHILVLGWLPSRSMLGFLSYAQFEGLLKQSQINTSETG